MYVCPSLKDNTLPFLRLLHLLAHDATSRSLVLVARLFDLHGRIDCQLKHLVDALRFLGGAFNVLRAHLAGHGGALLRGDGREALGAKELDAGTLCAQVGFEAYEDQGSVGAEVQDFRIPLGSCISAMWVSDAGGEGRTLSMTFSSELGQSIAKQTKRRSVSG